MLANISISIACKTLQLSAMINDMYRTKCIWNGLSALCFSKKNEKIILKLIFYAILDFTIPIHQWKKNPNLYFTLTTAVVAGFYILPAAALGLKGGLRPPSYGFKQCSV